MIGISLKLKSQILQISLGELSSNKNKINMYYLLSFRNITCFKTYFLLIKFFLMLFFKFFFCNGNVILCITCKLESRKFLRFLSVHYRIAIALGPWKLL